MHERLRTLHLTPHFLPVLSGIADYAGWLAVELAELGLDVRVLTGARSSGIDLPGVAVSAGLDNTDRRMWDAVAHEVEVFKPDVLHIHYQQLMYGGDSAIGYLPWALRLRRRRPPIVTTLHDMTPPSGGGKAGGRAAFEALLQGSDRLIVSGEAERRGVSRRPGLRSRTVVLPIGSNIPVRSSTPADLRSIRESVMPDASGFLLVYFGLIRPGKGLEVLLDSISMLRDRGSRVGLVVIGDVGEVEGDAAGAYRRRLIDQHQALGLEEQVRFVGRLPEDRVSEMLQASDAAVLPFAGGASTGHTSVFGALSHGLPLLTTQGPGTPSMFAQGGMSLVPAPPSAASLAEAIDRLMNDPTERAAIAATGRGLADRYRRPVIAREIATIYAAAARKPVEVAPTGSRGPGSASGGG